VDAIAVFPDRTPAFDCRNRMPKPQEITRYCASLVTITSRKTEESWRSSFDISEEGIQELQLAHFSVKEYLVSDRIGQSFGDVFEEIHARSTIVTVSLCCDSGGVRRCMSEQRAHGMNEWIDG
jgi:hypothetical protein